MIRTEGEMPGRDDLMWPTLQALVALGGSASIHELNDHVARDLDLAEGTLDIVHGNGP